MKDVVISIQGLQDLDSSINGGVEFVTEGKYEYADDTISFSYEESELTGLEGTTTTFTVTKNSVLMTRVGSLNAQIVFEEGKKYYFVYDTPYGKASMGVDTHSIRAGLDEYGGFLEIKYMVDMANTVVNRSLFKIYIKEIRNDN